MTDWNKPIVTSNYSTFPTEVKDRDVSIAKMDYSADTNVPDGFVRYNSTLKVLEKKNGASWDDILTNYTSHLSNTSNQHATTASQVGAQTTADFTAHTGNTSNPHATTASQVGALTASNNFSDVPNKATARTNLGLGALAVLGTINNSNWSGTALALFLS